MENPVPSNPQAAPKVPTLLISALIALAVVAGVLLWGLYFWYGPALPPGQQERVLDIAAGANSSVIARQLQTGQVVRSARLFRWFVRLTGRGAKLQAGEYAFPGGAGMGRVAWQLAEGKVREHKFTVPEGFTAAQIAERLQAEGLASSPAFLAVVHDRAAAKAWEVPGGSLEGFLFPDTYALAKGMTPEAIAKHMVDRFNQKVGSNVATAGSTWKMDLLRIITLASIIEREVRAPEERTHVAGVFYNRLRKKMRLESCATVLYAQGRISGTLSLKDLEIDSPYNTYRHGGFPPGPICSPGLSAILAAVNPMLTEDLFFVVNPDGRHTFSKDFEAHKRAKWQAEQAARQAPSAP